MLCLCSHFIKFSKIVICVSLLFLLDLLELRSIFEAAITTYKSLNIAKIAALASRLIARRSNSFRAQYGFKLLRKTNIAMSRLGDLDIIFDLENFLGSLPTYSEPGKIPLPTRNNIDFVLIRLQSLSKLFQRILTCAKDAATFFLNYVNQNFFLETCVMYLGVLAEIWTLAQTFCIQTVKFYAEIFRFRQFFRNNKIVWLPAGYELPETLDEFLEFDKDLENLKERIIIESTKHVKNETKKTLNSSKITMKKSIQKSKNHSFTKSPASKVDPPILENNNTSIDIGTAISRDTYEKGLSIETIKNPKDIQEFIEREDNLRKRKQHKQTIDLSEPKWTALRSKINTIIVTSQGKNCLKIFRKLWRNFVDNKR